MQGSLPNRVIAFAAACVSALAQAPASAPVLHMEAGTHSAAVNSISVDVAERYLVTGSDDNTSRVWDISTGRLLRTLRPPSGPSNDDKIYAVAISPDGRTVACGGWTVGAGSHSIYLFDRGTGQMARRLGNLPAAVLRLAYSRDGRLLLAALAGNHGVRLYRTRDYALAFEDSDYAGDVNDAAFSPVGPVRIASTSSDGYIRVYSVRDDGGATLLSKRMAQGGRQPMGVRFDFSASRLAIGFNDSATVAVLDSHDLTSAYTVDTQGLRGNLSRVAWSPDGSWLFAGGTYGAAGSPIVRWGSAGRGPRREFAAGSDTLMDLAALRNSSVAFGSADPACGVLDTNGAPLWESRGAAAVSPRLAGGFMVSSDGSVAGIFSSYGAPAYFSLISRGMLEGVTQASGMHAPITGGLAIAGWQSTPHPTLNGSPLPLDGNEVSRSLAIAPDHRRFVVGSEWHLQAFDASGTRLWRIPIPAVSWGVNITDDGKVVVASLGDGTIRWYRTQDGGQLLSLFRHADRRRWIAWTPDGYYDASPGGEDLMGWQVSYGPNAAADFFPASRFRSSYYRPEAIARALETAREVPGAPSQLSAAALPPAVTILSPADGDSFQQPEVTIRYTVRSPAADPVSGVQILVNGRPLPTSRRVVPLSAGDVREARLTLPPEDCEVGLIADNRLGPGPAERVRLRWSGGMTRTAAPKLYVLAIGAGKYRQVQDQLQYAAKDARDFANVLLSQKGRLYRDIESRILTDETANRDAILSGLTWLQNAATENDVAMVFLSGHGVNEGDAYYYLPVDFARDRLAQTAIPFSVVRTALQSIPGKVLFFVDSCHSGNALGLKSRSLDVNGVVNELSSAETGAVVFAASTGRQVAFEDPAWGNGAFTKAVVEGLGGKADLTGSGRVTVNMLDLYISERVKALTAGQQTPATSKPQMVPDFPVAMTH